MPLRSEGRGEGSSGLEALRRDAVAIFLAGVQAADPSSAVRRSIRLGKKGGLFIAGEEVAPPSTLRIIAVGKAACSMAEAAAGVIPEAIFPGPGIAVVDDANHRRVDRFQVLASGHPVPDERGARAAEAIEEHLSSAREGDGLLVLLSGGGSALLPAPAEGVLLDDKVRVTRLLLECGADIREINAVRKHLSRLKGGGLAARARPARVECLILSDVIGDDLSTIASGPTVPDPTTFAGARDILALRKVWDAAPPRVRARIEKGARGEIPETPKPGDLLFAGVENRLVGTNGASLDAAARKAEELGYRVEIVSRRLTGEARDAGKLLADRAARDRAALQEQKSGAPRALLAGGETTVTVRGSGKGGRNQELALAFAIEAEALARGGSWAFLSGGTDGRDGPTDAAGGLVDSLTLERGKRAGLDPRRALDENDSNTFLGAAGGLLVTGGTGTNVADLQVALLG